MMRLPMISPQPHSRPLLASLLVWAVPAVLLLDAAVAALGGWRPYGAIESGILLLAAGWALAATLLLRRGARAALAARWRELLLLSAVVAAGWPLLEFAAGRAEGALRPQPPFHTRGVNIRNTFHPDPDFLPGIHGPSRFTTGPGGLRAPAPPEEGQCRVIGVGGSTTECVYLDDTETWAALLPQFAGLEIPIWVGNAGISGFDTQDHLRFITSSPLLEDAAAIVVQPGINDLWRYLAGEVERVDYARFEAGGTRDVAPRPEIYRPWWSRSNLIQLYHTWRQPPPPPEQQEGIGGREYQIRRERRNAAAIETTLPDLDAGLSAYRMRIEAIIDAARARRIPLLFTTQAVLWREDLPPEIAARCWFGWLPDGHYLEIGALRDAMDQYNTALLDTCAKRGVPCVDLAPLNGNPEWFYDDCHFTEAGAAQAAERIAPALAALLQP